MIAGARHLVALMVFLGLAGVADAQTFERDTDRPGGDLYSSTTAAHVEKPADCQLLCNRELGCRAWTWVRPGVQGPTARCWIKSSITPAVRGICCTSGTKKSLAPRDWGPDDIVSDVDLPGSDYQHFQVGWSYSTSAIWECRDTCKKNSQCRAWTYVRPGVQGDRAVCWLKTSAPAQGTANTCCFSGVK